MDAVSQYVKRGLTLFKFDVANSIYKELFSDWKTVTDISKELYPELYKKGRPKQYKSRPHSAVSKYVNAFNELGWLEVEKDDIDKRKTKYRATLKPYFEYSEKKKLTKVERDTIEREASKRREAVLVLNDNFLQAMDEFVKTIVSLDFESYFQDLENIPLQKNSKIPIAISLALKYYDTLTIKLLKENLELKYLKEGNQLKDEKKMQEILNLIRKIEIRLSKGFRELTEILDSE